VFNDEAGESRRIEEDIIYEHEPYNLGQNNWYFSRMSELCYNKCFCTNAFDETRLSDPPGGEGGPPTPLPVCLSGTYGTLPYTVRGWRGFTWILL
jgi:hypothetical protein